MVSHPRTCPTMMVCMPKSTHLCECSLLHGTRTHIPLLYRILFLSCCSRIGTVTIYDATTACVCSLACLTRHAWNVTMPCHTMRCSKSDADMRPAAGSLSRELQIVPDPPHNSTMSLNLPVCRDIPNTGKFTGHWVDHPDRNYRLVLHPLQSCRTCHGQLPWLTSWIC